MDDKSRDAGELRELHLFAGAGGGVLAGHLLGRRCVCAVEFNAYARSVLVARQNDGTLPPFPIWDDVRTFDGRPWRGVVDVVAGGFPCQDISVAGKGDGLDGERSGLWSEFARIVREVRPRRVEVENSPMLTSRGLGRVLGDLAALGFDARWGVLGADDVGAPHRRERIWIVAHASSVQRDGGPDYAGVRMEAESLPEPRDGCGAAHVADAAGQRQPESRQRRHPGYRAPDRSRKASDADHDCQWWATESGVGRVADELADRLDITSTNATGAPS